MKLLTAGVGMLAAVIAFGATMPALAQKGVPPTTVTVGGHPMASDQDLMANLALSEDHTVLMGLLHAAGMVDGLRGHGPFTLFAPTNAAFAALPPGMLDSLRRPEAKSGLVALLSAQILPGNFSSARLHYMLRSNKGPVDLDTVNDGKLTVFLNGPANLAIRDGKGNSAAVTLYDVKQANGVLFVTDRVLQPG